MPLLPLLLQVIISWLVFSKTDALASPQRPRSRPILSRHHHDDVNLKIGSTLCQQQGVILVDMENVRGQSRFALSLQDLLRKLEQWTCTCHIPGQVIAVLDHGSTRDAYWTNTVSSNSSALAIVLAGPDQKADDVICRDIGNIRQWAIDWKQQEQQEQQSSSSDAAPILLVTADQGLISRCQKTIARKHLHVISPLAFLEELERLQQAQIPISSASSSPIVQQYSKELELALEYMLAYSKVLTSKNKHIPNKRRKVLLLTMNTWRQQLVSQPSDQAKSIHDFATYLVESDHDKVVLSTNLTSSTTRLHPYMELALVETWEHLRSNLPQSSGYKKETTKDRIVSAEQFRKVLQHQFGQATLALYRNISNDHGSSWPPAQQYIHYWVETRPSTALSLQQMSPSYD
jgi:hypothetical protein